MSGGGDEATFGVNMTVESALKSCVTNGFGVSQVY